MPEEQSHFTQADRNTIDEMATTLKRAVSDIAELGKKVDKQNDTYAAKTELDAVAKRVDEVDKRTVDFPTVRMIAYGLVALILTSVVGFGLTALIMAR